MSVNYSSSATGEEKMNEKIEKGKTKRRIWTRIANTPKKIIHKMRLRLSIRYRDNIEYYKLLNASNRIHQQSCPICINDAQRLSRRIAMEKKI